MRDTGVLRAPPWFTMRRLVVIPAALATTLVFASAAQGRSAAAPGSIPSAYHQSCLPDGTVRVTFAWTPSYSGPPFLFGWAQWLDLSLADNGFAPGTYVGAGPLAPSTASFTWDGIAPGRFHVARVNTHTGLGWEPSETSRFVTRTCATSSPARLASASPGECHGITFQWAPANPDGQVQWIDLSTANNRFVSGTYVHAGAFTGDVSSFYWTGLQQGTRHYWRVNTWTGSRWISSATGSFATAPTDPATMAAERILGAAARTMKGRDLPVFRTEDRRIPVLGVTDAVERAIALGREPYFGAYDGCFNQITVIEASAGDGSLVILEESMTQLPATLGQAQAQLKQLFPGARPAFDGGLGPIVSGADALYWFQHEEDAIWYVVVVIGRFNGNAEGDGNNGERIVQLPRAPLSIRLRLMAGNTFPLTSGAPFRWSHHRSVRALTRCTHCARIP